METQIIGRQHLAFAIAALLFAISEHSSANLIVLNFDALPSMANAIQPILCS
jgi:hypothetical protein